MLGMRSFAVAGPSHLEQFTSRSVNCNCLPSDVRSTSEGPPVWLISSASEDYLWRALRIHSSSSHLHGFCSQQLYTCRCNQSLTLIRLTCVMRWVIHWRHHCLSSSAAVMSSQLRSVILDSFVTLLLHVCLSLFGPLWHPSTCHLSACSGILISLLHVTWPSERSILLSSMLSNIVSPFVLLTSSLVMFSIHDTLMILQCCLCDTSCVEIHF